MRLTSMYMSRVESESLGGALFVDLMVKLFRLTYDPNATVVFTLRHWRTEELIVPMSRTLEAIAELDETIVSAIIHRLADTPVDATAPVNVNNEPFIYAFDGVYVAADVVRADLVLWLACRDKVSAAMHQLAIRVIGP